MWTPYTAEWALDKKIEPHVLTTTDIMRYMNLERLKSLMADGTPVYHIQYDHVFTSSIEGIYVTRKDTYLTLDDGTRLNTKNFGTVAFWTKSEADAALQRGE
jgi:hypothetical protein